MGMSRISRRFIALLAAVVLVALFAPLAWADEPVESAGVDFELVPDAVAIDDAAAGAPDAFVVGDESDDMAELDAVSNMTLEEFLGRMTMALHVSDTVQYDSAHAADCNANVLSRIINYTIGNASNVIPSSEGYGTNGCTSSFVNWNGYGLSSPTTVSAKSDPRHYFLGTGIKVKASSVEWVAKNVFNCSDAAIATMTENLPLNYVSSMGGYQQAQYRDGDEFYSFITGIGGPGTGYYVSAIEQVTIGDYTIVSWNVTRSIPASGPYAQKSSAGRNFAKIAEKTVDGRTFWSIYEMGTSYIGIDPADVGASRIAGGNRYDTSAAVTLKAYPDGSNGAIIATGATFPDALAASALAGAKGWPIITTESDRFSAATRAAIRALGANQFIVVGGTSAITTLVEDGLKKYGSVERIAGADRYQTAEKIYRKGAGMGAWSKTAIIACGSNYPDALSISGYACKTASPIFLASSSGLTSETQQLLRDGGFERVIIVGGTAAVPSSVDKWVKSNLGITPERLQGADRYATSRAIGEFCVGEGMSANKACIATGANFPDALVGASLVARNNSLMLLAADGCYESFKVLSAHKGSINGLYYLGGKNAVTSAMESAAKQAAGL